jgi:cell division protein FtsB
MLSGVLGDGYQQLRDALVQQAQECDYLRARTAELESIRISQTVKIEQLGSQNSSLQDEQTRLQAENKKLRDVFATLRGNLEEV